jgi:hypothetical protein
MQYDNTNDTEKGRFLAEAPTVYVYYVNVEACVKVRDASLS